MNNVFHRSAYFKLIEECVAQIVLHRSGYDPDFRAKKFEIDVDGLTNLVVGNYFYHLRFHIFVACESVYKIYYHEIILFPTGQALQLTVTKYTIRKNYFVHRETQNR